jgi:hypothetical protein
MLLRSLSFLYFVLSAVAGPVHAAEQDLYNPLGVGLRWDVDVELTTPGGKIVQGSAVREITGTEQVNGLTYFVVTTTFKDLPQMKDFTMYRRKTTRGVFAINSMDKEKREVMEAALPLTVGQTWKTTIYTQVIVSTVEAKESVTAGGKTYADCMKVTYKADGNGASGTYYQAPDVGNVLETTSIGGSTFKFTLKSFSGMK